MSEFYADAAAAMAAAAVRLEGYSNARIARSGGGYTVSRDVRLGDVSAIVDFTDVRGRDRYGAIFEGVYDGAVVDDCKVLESYRGVRWDDFSAVADFMDGDGDAITLAYGAVHDVTDLDAGDCPDLYVAAVIL